MSNRLGIFVLEVGQQSLEVEVYVVLAGLGLQSLLIGHDELAQPVDHGEEDVRGHETITQQFLSPQCPHGAHLFASLEWPAQQGMFVGSDCIHNRLCDAIGARRGRYSRFMSVTFIVRASPAGCVASVAMSGETSSQVRA